MSRTACAWIPRFELRARLSEQPELGGQALIIADASSTRSVVVGASDEAREQGVAVGMSMVTARALCPEALIIPPDAAFVREVSERVLRALYRFAPVVGRDGHGAFFLDLRGLERLHPDEQALAAAIARATAELCLPSLVAIADEPITAWIASRCLERSVVITIPPGEDEAFLAQLPMSALPMPDEIGRLCRVLGLEKVADLQRLPPGALCRRFGRVGEEVELRAKARAHEVYSVEIPVDPERVELPLDDPTDDYEVLLFLHKSVLDRLLKQVAARRRALAALSIELVLSDSDRSVVTHVLRPARPTLDGRAMLELVRLWLERGPLPATSDEDGSAANANAADDCYAANAMVDSIGMTAIEVAVAEARQLALFERNAVLDDDAMAAAIARLVAAFGSDSVVRPQLTSSYRPETRIQWVPCVGASAKAQGDSAAVGAGAGAGDGDVPPVLSLLAEATPVTLDLTRRWLAFGEHEQRELVQIDGPFHLEGQWWDQGFRRRYLLVRTDLGEVCLLYQEAALRFGGALGEWYLQGFLD
ncbi:MAG: DNA polymerase Y family protein [Myxococcales bacterium]|nr:DNA polymerase Y family protein [Myxococcales bacterium]